MSQPHRFACLPGLAASFATTLSLLLVATVHHHCNILLGTTVRVCHGPFNTLTTSCLQLNSIHGECSCTQRNVGWTCTTSHTFVCKHNQCAKTRADERTYTHLPTRTRTYTFANTHTHARAPLPRSARPPPGDLLTGPASPLHWLH